MKQTTSLCPFGREEDQTHPTCKSCAAQDIPCPSSGAGVSRLRKQAHAPQLTYPLERDGRKVLMSTAEVVSPNTWVNKRFAMRIYAGERKKWERALSGAVYFFGPHDNRKRELIVRRIVNDRRRFLPDKTNREGAMKPLEDALVKLGVLRDDRDKWLFRHDLIQEVDKANPRTEIEVIDPEVVSKKEKEGRPGD